MHKKLDRRWPAVALVSLVVMAVSACGANGSGGSGGDSDTVTLGLLSPITGAFSDIGENHQQGAQVAIDEINAAGGVLGGRQVELEVKDTSEGPQQAVQAVRNFIGDGQPLLLGELSSANCLAQAPVVEQLGGVFVTTTCTNIDLTGQPGEEAPYERFFRVGATDIAAASALYEVMGDQFPEVTDWDVFAFDYVAGHTQWEQYSNGLKENGIQLNVRESFFVPLDEQNYRPQVSALAAAAKGSENRGLYLGTYGAGTAAFLQQANPFGLADEYTVIANPGGYYPIARDFDGELPDFWNAYDYHYGAYDTEANQEFVSAFEELAGKKPVTWSYQSYLAVKAYAAAIDKAGSTEPDQVAEALRGITFDSPQGEYIIDATTQQGSANMVVTNTVGDPNAPEGIKLVDSVVVESQGAS